jgi:hypothetical protein
MRPLLLLLVSLPVLSAGCSKEQVDELASKVKEQVSEAPEVIREVLPTTGKVSLQLDRAVDIAYAEGDLYQVGASRSSLFQIRSYGKGDRESLPAVFLHAPVDAKSSVRKQSRNSQRLSRSGLKISRQSLQPRKEANCRKRKPRQMLPNRIYIV